MSSIIPPQPHYKATQTDPMYPATSTPALSTFIFTSCDAAILNFSIFFLKKILEKVEYDWNM